MDILTKEQMKQMFPTVSATKRELYLPFLNLAMARFSINNERRVAMFCANLAVESNNLARWVENLNYSAKRLTEVFPRRFPTIASAAPFVGNPRLLANKIYGSRMGNRAGTDDGFNFRGRCPIQATGREMYQELTRIFGAEFRVDFTTDPDALLNPKFGFMAAAAIFAVVKGCNDESDAGLVKAVCKKINGGVNGLAERNANYVRNLRILPDGFRLLSYNAMQTQFAKAVGDPDVPLMQNSTYDFEHDYDAIKDPPEVEPAINSETEFPTSGGAGVIIAPEPSDASDTSPDETDAPTTNSGDAISGGQVLKLDTGDKNVPDNFTPENKTINAPPPSGILKRGYLALLGLGLIPTSFSGVIETVKNAFADGSFNFRDVFDVMNKTFAFLMPYLFWIAIAFVVFWGLKELLKQVSFIVNQWTLARGDMHNVKVLPTPPPNYKTGSSCQEPEIFPKQVPNFPDN